MSKKAMDSATFMNVDANNRHITARLITYGERSRNGHSYMPGAFDHLDNMTFPVYYNHESGSQYNIMGTSVVQRVSDGLMVDIKLNDSWQANTIWERVKDKGINFVSLHAIMEQTHLNAAKDTILIDKADILEVSMVDIPGNAGALIESIDSLQENWGVEETVKNEIKTDENNLEGAEQPPKSVQDGINKKEIKVEKPQMEDIKMEITMPKTALDCSKKIEELKAQKAANIQTLNNLGGQMKAVDSLGVDEMTELKVESEAIEKEQVALDSMIKDLKDHKEAIMDQMANVLGTDKKVLNKYDNAEESYLRMVQNAIVAKDGLAIDDATIPDTISKDIIVEIGKNNKIIDKVMKEFNKAEKAITYLIATSNANIVKGPKGGVTNAKQTAIVESEYLGLGEMATALYMDDNIRTMSIAEFRQWYIDQMVKAITDEIALEIQLGAGIDGTKPYGVQGVASAWSRDLGLTKVMSIAGASLTYEDIIRAAAKVKAPNTKLILSIHPDMKVLLEESMLANYGNAEFLMGQLNSRFEIYEDENLAPAISSVTPDKPLFILGNYKTFKLSFAKGSMVQVGATSMDINRKNELYAHSDLRGSGVKKEQFVQVHVTGQMPVVAGASVEKAEVVADTVVEEVKEDKPAGNRRGSANK